MPQVWNQQQADYVRQTANDESNRAYQNALLAGESEDRALNKAKFAWQQTIDKAGLTGQFEGQWTMPSRQYFANTFGAWGAPTEGQQTLEAQGQYFGQGATLANQFGQYYAPGTAPTQGQQTLAAQNQANQLGLSQGGLTGWYTDPQGNRVQTLAGNEQGFTQGLRTQQEQRAAQAQQQQQAQQYLGLLSQLRGPADWFKYQEVLGATPGGMRDLIGAAMGQYVPGGGATTGQQPQAANLTTMMQQVQGQPVTWTGQGSVPQGKLNMPNVYQGGQGSYGQQPQGGQMSPQQQQMMQAQGGWEQQAARAQQYQQQMAGQAPGMTQYQPGGMNPAYQTMGPQSLGQQYQQAQQQYQGQAGQRPDWQNRLMGMASGQPQAAQQGYNVAQQGMQQAFAQAPQQQSGPSQQQNAMGNGTNVWGAQQRNQMNLPAPNQIAAQSWKNMAPSQQQMLLGAYESQGWDKNDVQSLYNQSLPKYASNAPTGGTFRLS